MERVREISPLSGRSVKIKDYVAVDRASGKKLGGQTILIEDWWQNINGKSWMHSNGNIAALSYAFRIGTTSGKIPPDDEVLYGKIDGLGYLVHISELCVEG